MVEKKSSKVRILFWLLMVALVLVAILIWFLLGTHWIHKVSTSIAPNGTVKYEIYDEALDSDLKNSNEDIVNFVYSERKGNDAGWKSLSQIELYGKYVSSAWSPDSKLFVVSLDNKENSLYLFDNENSIMRKLDDFLDMKLIDKSTFGSRLYRYMLSKGKDIHYEFVQWAKESDWMLIRYSVIPEKSVDDNQQENSKLSGYFWYNYSQNSLKGLVETMG